MSNIPKITSLHPRPSRKKAFGNAVHAVLPFLEHGGSLNQQGTTWLRDFLVNGKFVPLPSPKNHYNFKWLNLVLTCWDTVGELVSYCDHVVYEPKNYGKTKTDIFATHIGRAYFIEIKTKNNTLNSQYERARIKATTQVLTNCNHFHQQNPNTPLFGYILWMEYLIQERWISPDINIWWELVYEYP